MAEARDRLAAARLLAAEFPAAALSTAYYAVLYAARAALSEEERHAKTHSGTWTLFRETFVSTRRVDADLVREAERTLELRLRVDYDAGSVDDAQARAAIELAERFVETVDGLYAG
jgi:uncharacterized protein (UPF0332 family)